MDFFLKKVDPDQLQLFTEAGVSVYTPGKEQDCTFITQ